jgi:hypothetical protein
MKSHKADCEHIVKENRKNVLSKVKIGEINVQHTGPVSVIKWNDKKTSNDLYVSQ